MERDLDRVAWAERINISALTGRGVHRLAPALRDRAGVVGQADPDRPAERLARRAHRRDPPPVRGGKQPRVLFATQAANRPPTFVLFTTGFLEAGYRRFIERRLREDFGVHRVAGAGQRAGPGKARGSAVDQPKHPSWA